MTGNFRNGAVLAAIAAALGAGSILVDRMSRVSAAAVMAPRFEVDPMWPKPLPNHWLLGNVIGVAVDAQDHIWIVHRGAALERMETYAAATPPAPTPTPKPTKKPTRSPTAM